MRDLTEKARKLAARAAELSEAASQKEREAFGSTYGRTVAARAHEAAAAAHEKVFWVAREMGAAELADAHREAIYAHHAKVRGVGSQAEPASIQARHERITEPPDHRETFQARAVGRMGDTLWQREGSSFAALMAEADRAPIDKHTEINIRGQYTGDGQRHPIGRGRLVAVREHGRWTNFGG